MNSDDVTITLSRPKALALFEWAQRFMETGNPQFTHPADPVAVDSLATALEWALPEVLTDAFAVKLQAARAQVVSEYTARMGPQNSAWLSKLKYQDTQSGPAT